MATIKRKPAKPKRRADGRSGTARALGLTEADHKRLEAIAKSVGVNKSAYAAKLFLSE